MGFLCARRRLLQNRAALSSKWQDEHAQLSQGLSIISVIDGETTRHALDIANPPCNHLQCLRTIKNGNRIDLYLNGRRIWSGTWPVRPARVGASSEQSHMFKGVLLTNFFADSFAKSITGKESSSLI